MLNNYPELVDALKKCVRCGQCRSVCPIFEVQKKESAAPRGRVFLTQMINYGEITPSPEVVQHIGNCLLCDACAADCPSKLPVPRLMAIARTYLAEHGYLKVKRSIFGKLWPNNSFLKTSVKMLRLYQQTGLRSIARGLGLIKLLPGDLSKTESMLGTISKKSAREQLGKLVPAKEEKRFRVGYFLGCATDLLYPDVAIATVDVLTENGCEVVIPDQIQCCGMPQMANAAYDSTVALAKHNVDLLAQLDVDYIVSDCGTCTAILSSHGYSQILQGTPWEEKAKQVAAKVMDVNSFLIKKADLKVPEVDMNITLTYHDPCHMRHTLKVTKEPRELLKRIPGITIKESATGCCGGAGTFVMSNFDLSMSILDKKIESVVGTDADILATTCATCTMQLQFGLEKAGSGMKIMHPMQILSFAYQKARDKSTRGSSQAS